MRLALVTSRGEPVGELGPVPVATPWWQEVSEIVAAFGIDVIVLRLLRADRPAQPGGTVTYLAEYDGPRVGGLRPVADAADWLAPEPLRMPWAVPGGPTRSLAWATVVLGGSDTRVQQRTWNLSSVWRLDGAWLKEVPPFFAHEPAVLGWLGTHLPGVAPRLLGADGTRMVLEHVPGTDRYGAGPHETLAMLDPLHAIQLAAVDRVGELLALGVPDRRAEPFTRIAGAVVDRWAPALAEPHRIALARLVAGLPERFAELAACGVPDTLAHGDFHSGNVRGDGTRQVVLDWGDSTIGHPAADPLTLADRLPPEYRPALHERWCAQWRSAIPACWPERALELMRPLESLRGAVIYSTFLANIEPAEHPYHAADPPRCLTEAALAA